MSYDFSKAVDAARAVMDNYGNSESKDYKYPLVYPQKGQTVTVRLLFNPKSGNIVRLVNRHERIPCYRTYNQECPICKVQQQVKDATGQDPFGKKSSSKARGICFAQFVSSTAPISRGGDKGNIEPGELILFMHPWSVYQQINSQIQAVAQTPTGMDQAFCHAEEGLTIQVSVDNNYKYTTTLVPYLKFNPGNKSDEDFMKMLDEMDDLGEQVIPATITEDVEKQVQEYADAIYRQYIVPRTPSVQSQVPGTMNDITPTPPPSIPMTPQVTPPVTTPVPQTGAPVIPTPTAPIDVPQQVSSEPSCFGNHQKDNNTCLVCAYEVQCIEKSGVPF